MALGACHHLMPFISEFMIVVAGLAAKHMGLTILLLLLLTVVLGGLVRMVAKTVFGPKPDVVAKGELGVC